MMVDFHRVFAYIIGLGGSGGGGGGGVQPKSSVSDTAYEVGGVTKGSNLTTMTAIQIINQIFSLKDEPTIQIVSPSTLNHEIGTTLSNLLIKVKATKSVSDLTKIEIYVNSILKETITSGVTNGGTFSYTYDTNITTDTTIMAKLYYAGNPTKPKSASITLKFISASYSGNLTTLSPTSSQITALSKTLRMSKGATITYSVVNGKPCHCYPSSFGDVSSIKDSNNVDYTSSFTKVVVSIGGINYNCYILTDSTSATGWKVTFS